MEVFSAKRFILLTLATSSLLTSNIFCSDELLMSRLQSKEIYDKYSVPTGYLQGGKERSLNIEELKDWRPKHIMKMSLPTVNKMPHSAANLPLRFGKYMKESISRHVPNLPQRFGRTTAESGPKTLSDLLQQSIHSSSADELLYPTTYWPQELQSSDQEHPRRLEFKKIDDTELKQEK